MTRGIEKLKGRSSFSDRNWGRALNLRQNLGGWVQKLLCQIFQGYQNVVNDDGILKFDQQFYRVLVFDRPCKLLPTPPLVINNYFYKCSMVGQCIKEKCQFIPDVDELCWADDECYPENVDQILYPHELYFNSTT